MLGRTKEQGSLQDHSVPRCQALHIHTTAKQRPRRVARASLRADCLSRSCPAVAQRRRQAKSLVSGGAGWATLKYRLASERMKKAIYHDITSSSTRSIGRVEKHLRRYQQPAPLSGLARDMYPSVCNSKLNRPSWLGEVSAVIGNYARGSTRAPQHTARKLRVMNQGDTLSEPYFY